MPLSGPHRDRKFTFSTRHLRYVQYFYWQDIEKKTPVAHQATGVV